MTHHDVDVLVAGGGAGGIGAALAAARAGCTVRLVERAPTLGGTMVRGGVHCWEMGVGGTGIPFDIYRRLEARPQAVGIYSCGRHLAWPGSGEPPYPGGENLIDPSCRYIDTLRRHGAGSLREDEAFIRRHWHGVVFEPAAMLHVVDELLAETGRCEVSLSTSVIKVRRDGPRVSEVDLSDGTTVCARVVIDCTGNASVCEMAGAEILVGQEPKSRWGEPHAPDQPTRRVNGVTLVYRVHATRSPRIEPLPGSIPSTCWWRDRFPSACIYQYPCGDLNVNMLPTMEGHEFASMPSERARAQCTRRVLAHWHHLQEGWPEFRRFELCWLAPEMGVRESRRTVTEYVLSELDLEAGISGQRHEDVITLADHARDLHGSGGGCGELREPYGVPFRCLVPRGFENLLVACRGAGFSAIAASSCRLSRTMMQLGQAAGVAAGLSRELEVPAAAVPVDELRDRLRREHVELDWPRPEALRRYLEE